MTVKDSQLSLIKENLTKMIIALNNINKEEDSKRRLSEDITTFKQQQEIDFNNVYFIRNASLTIFDECNKMFF